MGRPQGRIQTGGTEREKAEAARAKKARDAAEKKRRRELGELADDVDGAWASLEKLVASSLYDEAVKLAVDLNDLATREGETQGFATRFAAMRKRQIRRQAFFDRWKLQKRS